MNDLYQRIVTLQPLADPDSGVNCRLVDHADGLGPRIAYWDAATLGPQPTQAELEAVVVPGDFQHQQQRTTAKGMLGQVGPREKLLRAVAAVLVDELNIVRKRDRDRADDVAAATSLADLKTRWAARAALADRTLAQAKAAIEAKLDSGTVDS